MFLYSLYFLLFFVVVEFELRASCLLGRCCITWAMPLVLFALVIFQVGSSFLPGLAWTVIILLNLLGSWDHRYVPPCPAYWLRWSFTNFLPRSSNHSLPIWCLLSSWDYMCEPPVPDFLKKKMYLSMSAYIDCLWHFISCIIVHCVVIA
jgi:hypothetical protein